MQARAIFEAAVEAGKETGAPVAPEIMVPLVVTRAGARHRQGAHRRHGQGGVARRPAQTIDYQVGTMIELPRAALQAGEIAETAEFFSFGTNDLTQTDARHLARRRGDLPRALHRRRASWPPIRS